MMNPSFDEVMKVLLSKIEDTEVKISNDVIRTGKEFYFKTNKLLNLVNLNPEIIKFSMGNPRHQIFDLLFEKEDKKISGFLISEFLMDKWRKNKLDYLQNIYNELEKEIRQKFKATIYIPRDNDHFSLKDRNDIISGNIFTSEISNSELIKLQKYIPNQYLIKLSKWYKYHTISNSNIQQYLKELESEMTAVGFYEFKEKNVISYFDTDGSLQLLYKGILEKPSDGSNKLIKKEIIETIDYRNRQFETLKRIPEFLELHKLFLEIRMNALNKLPFKYNNSYVLRYKLPQINSSMNFNNNLFKRIFKKRKKLNISNEKESENMNECIESPIIWISDIKEPQELCTDPILSSIMFYEMCCRYYYHTQNRSFYRIIWDSLKRESEKRKLIIKNIFRNKISNPNENYYANNTKNLYKQIV